MWEVQVNTEIILIEVLRHISSSLDAECNAAAALSYRAGNVGLSPYLVQPFRTVANPEWVVGRNLEFRPRGRWPEFPRRAPFRCHALF